MNEQKKRLITAIGEWKGSQDQTDDICIVGIEV